MDQSMEQAVVKECSHGSIEGDNSIRKEVKCCDSTLKNTLKHKFDVNMVSSETKSQSPWSYDIVVSALKNGMSEILVSSNYSRFHRIVRQGTDIPFSLLPFPPHFPSNFNKQIHKYTQLVDGYMPTNFYRIPTIS
jgi:hypothetical protein